MLTRRHLTKAAQLMHDYGELYTGSLEHNAAGFTGPSSDPYVPLEAQSSREHEPASGTTVFFMYEETTGRLIFSRR